jgi:putative membrane protein
MLTNELISDEELILRDKLAVDRTKMANQRTLLAYVRTGMYFVVTALAIFHLGDKRATFNWIEWGLMAIGVTLMLIGLISYFVMRRKLRN